MSIIPGLDWNQEGKTRPLKVEKPRMRRLREELRSTYCSGERKEGEKMFSSGGEVCGRQQNGIKSVETIPCVLLVCACILFPLLCPLTYRKSSFLFTLNGT